LALTKHSLAVMHERERKRLADASAGARDDREREQQLELIAAAVTRGVVEARQLPSGREAERLDNIIHQLRDFRHEQSERHRQLMTWIVGPFLAALLILALSLAGWL
jgi:hypothetical protein